MKALIWKELRENLKWALLAMLVLGGAELYALYPQNEEPENYIGVGVTICKTTFLTVTTFGCAAVGFLLGLIQILPELKQDRWASLLHRPVTRGVIFRGKAAAGLILYLVAAAPPFLLAIWLAATPGHFAAPFVPGMALPGCADLCMGAVYYFAALAVALQRGGSVALRMVPLFAALHVSYFVLEARLFYVALEAALLMAVAMAFAGWGAIYNGTSLRARPRLGQWAFVAMVLYGAFGLGDLAGSFYHAVAPSPESNFDRYELSDNGTPLHLTYNGDGVLISVRDLDGHVMTDPRYQPDRVRNHLRYLNTFSQFIGDSHGFGPQVYQPGYREARAYLWADNAYRYPRMEQWFTLVKENIMIGYLPLQKAAFAILDRRGFEPASATPEPFPPEVEFSYAGADAYCLWDSRQARYAFLARRELVDLDLPAPAPIYGVGNAWARVGNGSYEVMGVTLGTGMAVYDEKAAFVTLLPYHQQTDRWGRLSLGVAGEKGPFYLWYEPSDWINNDIKKTMPSYMEVMNLQGQVLRTYTLPPLPDPPRPVSWNSYVAHRIQGPVFFFGTMLYKKIGAELGSKRMQGELARQFGHDRRQTEETSLWVILSSLLCAGLTLFWTRKVHFFARRAWAWAAFVLAFNLAGLIAFRLASDWPSFVPCPRCSRRRPIEAGHCPHCGAGWPLPAPAGIEIIDNPAPELATT